MKKGWVGGMAVALVVAAALVAPRMAAAGENKEEKKASKQGEEYFSGEINSIDFKAGTVAVKKKDSGSMTFQSATTTKYYVKQKKEGASMSDFKVGDKVEVWYVVENGTPTIHRLAEEGSHPEKKAKKEGG